MSYLIDFSQLEILTKTLYSQSNKELIEKCESFFQIYKSNGVYGTNELCNYFFKTKIQYTLFWIMESLRKIIEETYSIMSNEQKYNIRNFLTSAFETHTEIFMLYQAISHKFSLVIVIWIKYEYPDQWRTVFDDFYSLIFKECSDKAKYIKIDMFIDIFITLDDELIKYRYTFDEFLDIRSTQIKDCLRDDHQLSNVLSFFNNLLQSYECFPQKTILNTLKAISQLIDWNNLSLFQQTLTIIQKLFNVDEFIKASLEVYSAISTKGQLIEEKINLLNGLSIFQLIDYSLSSKKILFERDCLYIVSDLVQELGVYFIESNMDISNSNEVLLSSLDILVYLIAFSLRIINISQTHNERKSSLHQVEFLHAFLHLLKNKKDSSLIDFFIKKEVVHNLISTIENITVIPSSISIVIDYDYRKDEDLILFRKDFLNLFQYLFKIPNITSICNEYIQNKFILLNQNKVSSLNEVELYLSMFNSIDNSDVSQKLLFSFIETNFVNYQSETILLLFYETVIKLIPLFNSSSYLDLLSSLSKLFLTDKGIAHSNIKIAGKITNLMLKFIEKTKSNLENSILIWLIENINQMKTSLLNTSNSQILSEFSSIFHLYGILINSNKLGNEMIKEKSLLNILTEFIEYGQKGNFINENYIIISKLTLNFFKSFNSEVKQSQKDIVSNFFSQFYNNIFVKADKSSVNIINLLNLFQKIIIVLGKDSLIFLNYFLSNDFIQFPTEDVFENSLKLLINLTSMLKKDSKDIIYNHFGLFYGLINKYSLPQNSISDNDKSILRLYESFIQLIYNVCFDFVEVLIDSFLYRKLNLLLFLMNVCLNSIDQMTRKKALKCLKGIIIYLIKLNDKETNKESLSIIDFTMIMTRKINFSDPFDINVS